jgi:hypothetical protein
VSAAKLPEALRERLEAAISGAFREAVTRTGDAQAMAARPDVFAAVAAELAAQPEPANPCPHCGEGKEPGDIGPCWNCHAVPAAQPKQAAWQRGLDAEAASWGLPAAQPEPAAAGEPAGWEGVAAQEAVAAIEMDLRGRRGLRHEWEQVDEDVQDEIRSEWRKLILSTIRPAAAPPPPPAREASPVDRDATDRLADAVAVLVDLGRIESRGLAADALLDYRNPPHTERSRRLAGEIRAAQATRQEKPPAREVLERAVREALTALPEELRRRICEEGGNPGEVPGVVAVVADALQVASGGRE